MALFNCGECGKTLSDKAMLCPHCGAPAAVKSGPTGTATASAVAAPEENPGGTVPVWALVAGALVVGFILLGVLGGGDDSPRGLDRRVYKQCLSELEAADRGRASSAGTIAGACEGMRQDFVRKHGVAP